MTIHVLKILFVISKSRINRKGVAPINCRITYNKKRKEFATGLFINPDYWNSKKQKAFPLSKENDFINSQLSLISQKISKAFLVLQVREIAFDVEDVFLQYRGRNIKREKHILEVFDIHNERMYRLIGKEYSKATYSKFIEAKNHTSNFIKHTYNKNDFLLSALTLKFLDDFDFYLKSERNQKQITINKSIQRVRKIIKLAISEGFLDKDPFVLYKLKRIAKKVVFLTTDELKLLEDTQLRQERLQAVKDLFVFCCYTGLAYAEMSNFDVSKHLKIGFDGNEWIEMYRADILGIEKNLTHHIARKTFATTVLLYNDVPMEIVSELLGHSKLAVTQEHYAKVTQRKVSEQIGKLKEKIGK